MMASQILEYEIKDGQSITFRVGGSIAAFMQRVGDAPDADMYLDADGGNVEPITVAYENALAGPQSIDLLAGQRLKLNPVLSRHWKMTAPNWE